MRGSARAVMCGIIAAVILCALPSSLAASEQAARQRMKEMERPDADKGPTPVKIGFYLVDIASISDADQSLTADAFFSVVWKDSRLAGSGYRYLKLEDLPWYPDVMLLNKREAQERFEEVVLVAPDGSIQYSQRLYGTFGFPMDLRDFPFDKHEIPFTIVSAGQGPEDVTLIVDEGMTGRDKDFSLSGWMVEDVGFTLGTYTFEPNQSAFNMLTFTLAAHRDVNFYIWRIMVPLALIVFMSWMVFWIDPSHLEAQVGISATSILTLIAFQFTVGVLLPRLGYLTRMDHFVFFSSLLVFLALVEGVTTSALASKGRRELALKFDAWSRVLFPAAFLAAILISFVF